MALDDEIRRMSAEVANSSQSEDWRKAARSTGGIPVYADIGGILIVASPSRVLRFDLDTERTEEVTDPRWRSVAFARAARQFPSLSTLMPQAPQSARQCDACGGAGSFRAGVPCGTCSGLGWIE